MKLKILLPFKIFASMSNVSRIVVDTLNGSFGILPHRRDCVAALTPGILIYETPSEGEVFVAIDTGVLIKTGLEVSISVHNAITGTDLGKLKETIEQEFLQIDKQEQKVRTVLMKMENGLIGRLAELQRE